MWAVLVVSGSSGRELGESMQIPYLEMDWQSRNPACQQRGHELCEWSVQQNLEMENGLDGLGSSN